MEEVFQVRAEVEAILDEHFGDTPIPERVANAKVKHLILREGRYKLPLVATASSSPAAATPF